MFKHVLLTALLEALNRKETPWCFLDTHAGAGSYDLKSADAERTGEWRDGVARLSRLVDPPPALAHYLQMQQLARQRLEGEDRVRRAYAGSPLLAALMARRGDRILACDSVPEVAESLSHNLAMVRGAGRHVVQVRDGYRSEALLPFAEKRGLVLIDPPFERHDELDAVCELLARCLERFGHGVFAIWYPLKQQWSTARFLRRSAGLSREPVLNFTLDTDGPADGSMRACGLLVVNPPFLLQEQMEPCLRRLAEVLAQGPAARAECTRLDPDSPPAPRRANDADRTRPSRQNPARR